MTGKFFKAMFLANLVLSLFALIVVAAVPDKIVVQGRATILSSTLTGTATVLPLGLSQPFTINTDAYGIFQFDLTNLVPEAFENPNSLLRLEIGTTTIDIPFRSVPFALRAAKADALSVEAPAQFIMINVTTITAVSVNVTSITVSNIIISSATVDGTMRVGGGVKVGRSIILGPFEGTGADNNIVFTNGDGIIKTADPNAGILKIETAVDKDIIISPGSNLGIGTLSPVMKLDVNGGIRGSSITATAGFYGDGSALQNIPGDNLGNHEATTNLNMHEYNIISLHSLFASDTIQAKAYWTNGWNSFLGFAAGNSNPGDNNTGVGYLTGNKITSGKNNTFMGASAGSYNTTGSNNVFMGFETGKYLETGSANTLVGVQAGGIMPYQSFSSATLLGYHAGYSLIGGGDNNIFIGFQAGDNLQVGTGNIVIGHDQDVLGGSGTNNFLNIGGVLYGDLSAKTLGISKTIPAAALDVVSTGTAANQMAQIWRNSSGIIVASMSATGVIKASKFLGDGSSLTGIVGDNLGDHTATTDLAMSNHNINAVNAISATGNVTAARYQISGDTVLSLLAGTGNIGVGRDAGQNNTGSLNTFIGASAGQGNISGSANSFIGNLSGASNTTGQQNVFVGATAGTNNTTGWGNSFLGYNAGAGNIGGVANTFLGYMAGVNNVSASNNAFLGYYAGASNTTGNYNTIIGASAGRYNQTGSGNAIFGAWAGYSVTDNSFSSSTIIGRGAGYSLTNGNDNIFVGWQAGFNVTSGAGNIVIGYGKDTSAPTASNELNIGGVLYGDLSAKTIGISTRVPQAALDVVSTGTTADQMAQIWRDSDGVVRASMSATGVMMADKFIGDGSGLTGITGLNAVLKTGDTMTGPLTLLGSTLTITGNAFSVGGATLVVVNGNVGIGTVAPWSKLQVSSGAIVADGSGSGLYVGPRNSAGAVNTRVNIYGTDTETAGFAGVKFFQRDAFGSPYAEIFAKRENSNSGVGLDFIVSNDLGDIPTPTTAVSIKRNGNVGIGTTAPGYRLAVDAGGVTTALVLQHDYNQVLNANKGGQIEFRPAADGGTGSFITTNYYGAASEGRLTLQAYNQANQLVLHEGGNVGIGTTGPDYRLLISSGAGEAGTIMAVSTGTSNLFWVAGDGAHAVKFFGDGSNLSNITAAGAPPTGVAGGVLSGTYPNPELAAGQTAAVTWSGAQTFSGGANFPGPGIWNTSGNVGIGTIAPTSKLEVNGRIKDQTGYLTPVGTIITYVSVTPPQGWLYCNGQSLDRNTYPELFAVIECSFGCQDSSSFNIPDLRGEFVRGFDTGKGVDSGRIFGSPQEQGTNTLSLVQSGTGPYGSPTSASIPVNGSFSNRVFTGSSSGSVNWGLYFRLSGAETRPHNIALAYMIKY